jgi:hypothetical protein
VCRGECGAEKKNLSELHSDGPHVLPSRTYACFFYVTTAQSWAISGWINDILSFFSLNLNLI